MEYIVNRYNKNMELINGVKIKEFKELQEFLEEMYSKDLVKNDQNFD